MGAKDVFELRDSIVDLIQNKEKMAKYSAKIQDDVVEKFSKKKMLRETLAVYNN